VNCVPALYISKNSNIFCNRLIFFSLSKKFSTCSIFSLLNLKKFCISYFCSRTFSSGPRSEEKINEIRVKSKKPGSIGISHETKWTPHENELLSHEINSTYQMGDLNTKVNVYHMKLGWLSHEKEIKTHENRFTPHGNQKLD